MLPFIHAFGGCDTTSGIHDKGKQAVLKLITQSDEAKKRAVLFSDPNSSKDEVCKAGIEIFILLYGGTLMDSLQELRYRKYIKMAASSSKLSPSKLPPTERAASFHSLRVKLQVAIHVFHLI